MSPEAQRIAIAKTQGWKWAPEHDTRFPWWNKEQKEVAYENDLPDYLNDLNAMHGAEETLTPDQFVAYFDRITMLFDLYEGSPNPMTISAKADQRAEAFIRSLNLWKA